MAIKHIAWQYDLKVGCATAVEKLFWLIKTADHISSTHLILILYLKKKCFTGAL